MRINPIASSHINFSHLLFKFSLESGHWYMKDVRSPYNNSQNCSSGPSLIVAQSPSLPPSSFHLLMTSQSRKNVRKCIRLINLLTSALSLVIVCLLNFASTRGDALYRADKSVARFDRFPEVPSHRLSRIAS